MSFIPTTLNAWDSAPEIAARRSYFDQRDSDERARIEAEEMLTRCFLLAASVGDMDAVASFAPTTTDYTKKLPRGGYGRRDQTVGEVLFTALMDEEKLQAEAMRLLCALAKGDCPQAKALMQALAQSWANNHAEDEL